MFVMAKSCQFLRFTEPGRAPPQCSIFRALPAPEVFFYGVVDSWWGARPLKWIGVGARLSPCCQKPSVVNLSAVDAGLTPGRRCAVPRLHLFGILEPDQHSAVAPSYA